MAQGTHRGDMVQKGLAQVQANQQGGRVWTGHIQPPPTLISLSSLMYWQVSSKLIRKGRVTIL